jgi:hypothetical protein
MSCVSRGIRLKEGLCLLWRLRLSGRTREGKRGKKGKKEKKGEKGKKGKTGIIG